MFGWAAICYWLCCRPYAARSRPAVHFAISQRRDLPLTPRNDRVRIRWRAPGRTRCGSAQALRTSRPRSACTCRPPRSACRHLPSSRSNRAAPPAPVVELKAPRPFGDAPGSCHERGDVRIDAAITAETSDGLSTTISARLRLYSASIAGRLRPHRHNRAIGAGVEVRREGRGRANGAQRYRRATRVPPACATCWRGHSAWAQS